jgi:hypothetical protein
MKNKNLSIFLKICGLSVLFLTLMPCHAMANNSDNNDPFIKYMLDPVYPTSLSSIGITEGTTTILVSLDSNGKLLDWLAISSTKLEFVRAIGEVIDKWEFVPAKRNGKTIPFAMCISMKFRSEGVVISLNGFQIMRHFISDGRSDEKEIPLLANYSQLDRMPEPASVVQPVLGSDIPVEARSGEVTIMFIIDDKGNVRMPVMMECTGDIRLAYAAYDALSHWKFNIPTRHNKPTMVRASQKFIFKGGVVRGE